MISIASVCTEYSEEIMNTNTSGYTQDLFDKVVKFSSKGNFLYENGLRRSDIAISEIYEHAANKIEVVETILRWRGFLVKKKGEKIFLSAGSHYQDISLLGEYGIYTQNFSQSEDGFNSEILNPDRLDMNCLSELFQLPSSHRGFTGPGDFGGLCSKNWNTFQRCAFGVKVPVKYLDPGIALLVKVMPLLGLHTVMSCDEHLDSSPIIYFKSKYHLNWAKVVLLQYGWKYNLPDGYNSSSWLGFPWKLFDYGIKCEFGNPTEEWQLRNIYLQYSHIQDFCKYIMNTDVAEKARHLKTQLRETDL
jgi:hypothetical protein